MAEPIDPKLFDFSDDDENEETADRRGTPKEVTPVFRFDNEHACPEFRVEDRRPGKCLLWFEGGGGPPMAVEFDTLEDAIAEARREWGSCLVWVEQPDGTPYKFDEAWDMPFAIHLLRMRKGPLNPRQQTLLGKWEENPRLRLQLRIMRGRAVSMSDLHALVEDLDDPAAGRKLLAESLDWRLFEIIEWNNGSWEPTDEMVDKAIEVGMTRSL